MFGLPAAASIGVSQAASAMRLRLTSTPAGLTIGITAAVGVACALGAYLYSRHHFEALLASARDAAVAQGTLIRDALEHEMIENDRTLIERMVADFGRQPRVSAVVLLDHNGVARISSGPEADIADLSVGSPTCQACHRLPAAERGTSRVIEMRGGTVLRTVVPFENRAECHTCHDPDQAVNGILLMDLDVGELRSSMNQSLRWIVASTGGVALLLIGLIALVVRLVVLRRLRRFETTARLIAAGDLERRVPDRGSDTIAWLAREFNTMADSMSGLVSQVRHQHERLETVINGIDDGIVVLDGRREILAANAAFLRRIGQARDQVLGCCCREVASAMCTTGDCPAAACLRGGERQVRICERRGTDGTVAWEEVHASPIVGADGRLELVVEVWRDISARRAAEARLAESHRLASLGMLASGFSHELNTPLATVLTCVEGLLRDAKGGEGNGVTASRVAEAAAIARDQVLRCRSITQHFLRLSRGQASSGDLVDVETAVAAVARLVTPTAHVRSVQVTIDPVPAGLRVRADEAEFQHAIVNLLLNAIQASPDGSTVSVTVTAGDTVQIRISDSGCGIPPEQQARIFEPFVSLRPGGTGLGLFLSLNFVRRWGGDIRLTSTPGAGSTFEVVVPILSGALEHVTADDDRDVNGFAVAR